MSRDPVDIETACVHRIQRMRNEVDIFNKGRENGFGPIFHALEYLTGFSLSLSEWSEHHLCRFQVVIHGQTHEALFPNEYVVSDNDKTLKAITEDGFFVSADGDFATPALSGKLHSGFFMDLLQLSAKAEEGRPTSLLMSESNNANIPSTQKQKVAISQALEHVKGLSPATETSQLLSHSLFHNFLKYVASMEHLAYPELPFWCPRYVSNLVSLMSKCRFRAHFNRGSWCNLCGSSRWGSLYLGPTFHKAAKKKVDCALFYRRTQVRE